MRLHGLWVKSGKQRSDSILHLIANFLALGFIALGCSVWLIIVTHLAYKSQTPAHGTILNILGAVIIGFPVWMFWLGYLLASGKLTDQPA